MNSLGHLAGTQQWTGPPLPAMVGQQGGYCGRLYFPKIVRTFISQACMFFWNLTTPPSRGEACVPPLGSGWPLVTALSSGRSDGVSLPRLGHKNVTYFHLVIWGHLVLEPGYQAMKGQTSLRGDIPQHSHMYELWSVSTSHLTYPQTGSINC